MKIKMQRIAVAIVTVIIVQSVLPYPCSYASARTLDAVRALSLPDGQVGQSYEYQLKAEGGMAPLAWRLVGGELPPGISLEASGSLKGVPNTLRRSAYAFTVEVSDSSPVPQRFAQPFLLMIQPALLRVVMNQAKLKIVNSNDTSSEKREPEPAVETTTIGSAIGRESAVHQSSRAYRVPVSFLARSESGALYRGGGSVASNKALENVRTPAIKEQTKPKDKVASPFGEYEQFNPATFIRIYE